MSGIDRVVMEKVAILVARIAEMRPDADLHTVTATANGSHGGVDLVVDGTLPDGVEWQAKATVQ